MAKIFSKSFYNSKEWKCIRDSILKRDNYLCKICSSLGNEVHHIIWLTRDNINNPMISSGASNLVTLCRDCHCNIHTRGKSGTLKTTQTKLDGEPEYIFNSLGELVLRK